MKTNKTNLKVAHCAMWMSLTALMAAGGCMVGPSYQPPATTMPAAYREVSTSPTTAPALVIDQSPAEMRWWRRFGDPAFTKLVEKSIKANYGIAVAEARLR